jgi:hypothetical protein
LIHSLKLAKGLASEPLLIEPLEFAFSSEDVEESLNNLVFALKLPANLLHRDIGNEGQDIAYISIVDKYFTNSLQQDLDQTILAQLRDQSLGLTADFGHHSDQFFKEELILLSDTVFLAKVVDQMLDDLALNKLSGDRWGNLRAAAISPNWHEDGGQDIKGSLNDLYERFTLQRLPFILAKVEESLLDCVFIHVVARGALWAFLKDPVKASLSHLNQSLHDVEFPEEVFVEHAQFQDFDYSEQSLFGEN